MVLINPDEFHNKPENAKLSAILRQKTPKRVLHFSDGVLEEYSDVEEDEEPKQEAVVDLATLPWLSWLGYKAWFAGNSTLSWIDYFGESLAAFFGITTPKYYFELEEYKRQQNLMQEQDEQQKGWSRSSDHGAVPLQDIRTMQPGTVPPV